MFQDKCNLNYNCAVIIFNVITFHVIIIDYIVILFSRN